MSLDNFARYAIGKKAEADQVTTSKPPEETDTESSSVSGENNKPIIESQADKDALVLMVEQIDPDPNQPRSEFLEIAERAASIKAHSLLMPIVVRPHPTKRNRFIIIDGECRWRAHKEILMPEDPIHYSTIKASLRDISTDPGDVLVVQLIANIQRDDLKPLEAAQALDKIKQAKQINNKALAKLVHKSESQISRLLKLLKLSEQDRARIASGELSARDVQREKGIVAATESPSADQPNPRQSRLSISMQTAASLAGLLKQLAQSHELAEINLGKGNKKDLIAILETRTAEILGIIKR